jgi:hypothetical protein
MLAANRPTIQVLDRARRLPFADWPIDRVMLPAVLMDGGGLVVLERLGFLIPGFVFDMSSCRRRHEL